MKVLEMTSELSSASYIYISAQDTSLYCSSLKYALLISLLV